LTELGTARRGIDERTHHDVRQRGVNVAEVTLEGMAAEHRPRPGHTVDEVDGLAARGRGVRGRQSRP